MANCVWQQAKWVLVNGGVAASLILAAAVAFGAKGGGGAAAAAADEGDGGGPGEQVRLGSGDYVTDAQVVASMQKGIEYLLSVKKNNNWEIHKFKENDGGEPGGETALVLYALLHAGQSLQDSATYQSKLHWHGKELWPAVQWLEKNAPIATYAAGLEASALTLLPKLKDQPPTESPAAALDACKYYVLLGMGPGGGYTYYARWIDKVHDAWKAYAAAALRGNRNGPEKKELDDAMKAQKAGWGGSEIALQMLASELKHAHEMTKDQRELAKIEAEMKELQNYSKDMPDSDDHKKELTSAKRELAKLESAPAKDKNSSKIDDLKAKISRLEGNQAAEPYGDHSNGQYGTLGAWALADYGLELPDDYWKMQDRFWRKIQMPDGGWSYQMGPKAASRNTMTVAGIASLFVCQEFLDNELRLVPKPDKNIDSGLAWLTNEYTAEGGPHYLYYMYGVERVGLSSGFKFFGTKDWYKIGASQIVKRQKPDGSWKTSYPETVDTSYALLFLSRGRNPVVFNKLQYDGYWNARAHDDAYVTRWMSKRFEKPINWQVVNLQTTPEEWQDAPILLITGSQDPKFTPEHIAKLKAYINAGGMIFSSADGGTKDGAAFTNAMKKYASQVVDGKYEMRQLPKDHALFSKDLEVDIPNPPTLMGISNDVRELWVHSPQDVGADWQLRKYSSKNFDLAAAMYFYASGKGSLRSKLQPLTVAGGGGTAHSINLARVDYPGNSDPEPGAWPRMIKLAAADFKTQLSVATVAFDKLDPKKTPVAHLTGTTRVTFTDDDAKALKTYLDAGGMLFIDAAGGSQDFGDSCRKLLAKAYPNESLEPLSIDHPIYTGSMPDGAKLDVHMRRYADLRMKRRVTTAALEELVSGGRTRVIFSQWDICSGFLGTNTWGILGYTPATSEQLAQNILLYSLTPSAGVEKGADAAK